MPVAYLCDFDGTISPVDIGASFIRRFSGDRFAEAHALLARWRAGEIGSRELTAIECGWLSVAPEEALEFARSFEIDADFAPFVGEADRRGETVMVVSDGLDFYVRDHLERAGLGHLAWTANRSRFEAGGVCVDFESPAGCGQCGNCKGAHVRRHREQGYEVVLVGDGLSDRCGARLADHVLARGDLLEWCRHEGVPAVPFAGFGEVRLWARSLAGRGAATASAIAPPARSAEGGPA
jgi:2-hydroxy-3-keto-5-methylthiopentenyl-1-phosphate phosphatase